MLIATITGGVPLLISAFGILCAVMLPLSTAGSTSAVRWLEMAALSLTPDAGGLKLAALLVTFNALPMLIFISAYVIPRPWDDGALRGLVLAWLLVVLVSLIYRAWEFHSIMFFCVTAFLPAVALVYFVWLSVKTLQMANRRSREGRIAGLGSRVLTPVCVDEKAGAPQGPLRRRAAIELKLERVRTRVRLLVALHGLSWIAGAVITAAMVLGLADYLTRSPDRGLRMISSLALLAVVGWTCYRYLYLGLVTRLGDLELASRLQRRFPSLGDGLSSAVEFLVQPEDDPTAGSVALRRAVIAQTTADCDGLDFRHCIEPAPTVRAALSTLVICLTALSLLVLDPLSSGIAAVRLVNPLSHVTWPQTYRLVLCEEVTRVARGQVFEVEVVDQSGIKLPSDVRIHYRLENPDGTEARESELMRFVDGTIAARRENGTTDPKRQKGVMVARRENVTRPFSYRVEGGDDHSMPWIPVEVVDPPTLESVSVTLTPPDYTGWPPERAEKNIRALVGTRVEIRARSTKPLESALLCLEGGGEIQAQLGGEASCQVAVGFVVESSGACWFRLTELTDDFPSVGHGNAPPNGQEGLTGGSDTRWEIRAVPDVPPTVSIEQPAGNVFVTPHAVVPVQVAAKDDLAVHRIELAFSRSDRPEENDSLLPLYVGPDRVEPQAGGLSSGVELGHNLVPPPYNWQLSELGLRPGAQITFHAIATDYRPGTGKSEPRRLVIITPEELTERIAARQASIISKLSRVLEMQRQSRRQVGDLEIRLGEVGRLSQLDVDHLRGAELGQREVSHTLSSRSEGVPMHILSLLADLENNKVDSPDIQRQMHALLDEIDRLARQHLPVIGRELTSAIKAVQVRLQDQPADDASTAPNEHKNQTAPPDPAVVDPLAAAGRHQDQVIASLEQMLDQLGEWDRYRRFHSEISHLLRDQEEHHRSTKQLGGRTLTKELDDLLPQESADLKILARRQFDLAHQLDNVQQAMQRAGEQLRQSNPLFAETVSDALYRARELAVSGRMRSAGGDIQQNQMGQASRRQEEIIQNLREILDVLANRREHELGRLIKQLRDAESELAEMAAKQEGLRKQIEEAERLPDEAERGRQLERLSREQEQLEEQAERMSRRLERLLAESAGQTVAQAAEKMHQAAESARQGSCQAASQQAHGAKQDLDEARRQVQERRLEAEVELALEQMARLEETLQGMHRREERIIEETLRLDQLAQDQGRLSRAQNVTLRDLARDQDLLRSETVALTKKLVGAEVFNLALSGAASEMARAAALLGRGQTGGPAQRAEQNALRRLGQLLEALKPEEPEEEPDESDSGQGGQGESGQPPGSGVQTLVELKLLKLLQQEINLRTRELEEALGPAETLTDEARREYTQLSEEQGRLADLLLNLITPQEDPEDNPNGLPGQPLDGHGDDLLPPLDAEDLP